MKTNKVKTDSNGYASRVRCGQNHSGNHLLAGPVSGHWQCCGCGKFFSGEHVSQAQSNSSLGGEIGSGGLISRAQRQPE